MSHHTLDTPSGPSFPGPSEVLPSPVSRPLLGPIEIKATDVASLKISRDATRDFITTALTELLGPELRGQFRVSAEVRGLDPGQTPSIEFAYELPGVGPLIGRVAEGGLLRADRLSDGTIVVDLSYGGPTYFFDEAASSAAELSIARGSGDTFIRNVDGTVLLVSSFGAEKLVGGQAVLIATDENWEPASTLAESAAVFLMTGAESEASFIAGARAAEMIAQLLRDNDNLREYLLASDHWTVRMVGA